MAKRLGMVIDTVRCQGCHTCCMACKIENNLPDDNWWNRVVMVDGGEMDTPVGTYPNVSMTYRTMACQHCDNPACVKACPVGATYKRKEDGIIVQDYDICIGCRTCMVACPYNVRIFNWKVPEYRINFDVGDPDVPKKQKSIVEKCTFCVQRVSKDLKPACIDVCLGRARFFGDFNDPDSEVSKLLSTRRHYQLLPELGTKPSIYFLV